MPETQFEIIDFFADWCGACQQLKPILEEIAKEGKAKITALNVDDPANQEISRQFQVRALPTLIIKKKGQVINHLIGYQSKQELLEKLV